MKCLRRHQLAAVIVKKSERKNIKKNVAEKYKPAEKCKPAPAEKCTENLLLFVEKIENLFLIFCICYTVTHTEKKIR